LEQKGRVKEWPLCGNPPVFSDMYTYSFVYFNSIIVFQNSCCLFHTPFLTHIIPSPDFTEDRLVERVSALEAPQPRLEKRLAELDGKVTWEEVEWDVADVFFP